LLETERLGEDGDDGIALLNVAVPITAGLGAALLGWAIGRAL
jgi:fluoride ion exporter CrcB/FEX